MGRLFDIHVQGLSEPFFVRADPQEDDLMDLRERRLLVAWRRVRFSRQGMPFHHEMPLPILDETTPLLAELMLQPDGDFRYTRFGRTLTSANGGDLTGRKISEFPTPVAKAFLSVYRLAVKTQQPYATRHKPPAPSQVSHWLNLILPLRTESYDVGGFLICGVPMQR